MELLFFFLPAIAALGLVTSYTDVRLGKIRNLHVALALVYVAAAYSAIISYSALTGVPVRLSYLTDLGLNMAIALAFGFAAWHFRVWSAADGKLFLAYSGLVPLTAYSMTYFAYFPSFVVLINTFFPVFAFLMLRSFLARGREKKAFLKRLKPVHVLTMLVSLFWMSWFRRLLAQSLNFDIGMLANILIVVSAVFLLKRLLNWKVSGALAAVRLVADHGYVASPAFALEFAVIAAVSMGMMLVMLYSGSMFTRRVGLRGLRPGMMLADRLALKKGKYVAMDELETLGRGVPRGMELLGTGRRAEGLTADEIEELRKLGREGKLCFDEVKVMETLPFSPFLFIGVLITILAQGSFLNLLALA